MTTRSTRAAILLLILSAGCQDELGSALGAEGPDVATAEITASSVGLVTGGIYESGAESFATDGDAIFCELDQLGISWIRIESHWPGTSPETYRDIVRTAHAHGIRVAVVVAASTCPAEGNHLVGPFPDSDSASIDAFTAAYVDRLDGVARDVFSGDAAPDAWEITNEPNIFFNPDYPPAYAAEGCVEHSRIDGNTFAWLLRRVYEWRERAGRDELIVSGGTLGVPDDPWSDGWYGALLRSGAWGAGPAPVDYWGVHPYQPFSYDNDCINRGETSCFGPWADSVQRSVRAVREAIAAVAGRPVPLFASEIGWALAEDGTLCTPASMCVRTTEQLVTAMHAAFDAMDGEVDVALWYLYRDYPSTRMGVREVYDAARELHPAKEGAWSALAEIAGGAGGDPDACWSGGGATVASYDALVFDARDARRSSRGGDWRFGSFKAQCAAGAAVTGLSASPTTGIAHAALCAAGGAARPQDRCSVRDFSARDDRGTTSTGDWDWGRFKGECAAGQHVAGISQTTDHRVDAILCCESDVEHRDCETRDLVGGDDRGARASGDWDYGNYKAECGDGRSVAGVSRDPGTGRPHAILCCR